MSYYITDSGRSCNENLHDGMTDRSYKKIRQERWSPEKTAKSLTDRTREDLYDVWYGIKETKEKMLPDGTTYISDDYVATKEAQIGV
jgi:hypothetical protein